MLNSTQIDSINSLLGNAVSEGRSELYEFEVYSILDSLGLAVPRFRFIESVEEVDDSLLTRFDEKIVLKIVSSQIAHKQKIGGVQIVANGDPLFIQYVLTRMREQVLRNTTEEPLPVIAGFLLVEYIDFKPALGQEILTGFKQDPAFGPILTLSKGGEDAEFFARYYDPPNLFAPPLDLQSARDAVSGLKIRHRFEEIGQPGYMEKIAEALSAISALAYTYSFIPQERQRFTITALDVNPFVFSRAGEYIAVDGYARFEPVDDTSAGMPPVHTENLEPFFNPRGIAVIGVSRDLTKGGIGIEIALKLHQLGRRDIYFINPRGGSLQLQDTEYPLYRDINDITEKVELIVYAAPASRAAGFLSTLPPDRYRSLIFISGIPADVSYDDYVQELDKSVPPGLRIIGPNCIGIISTAREEEGRVNTFFLNQKWLKMRFTPMSNTVLLAQSGGFAISEIDRLQNANMFRALVSFGNKYDVKITDFIAYFNQRSDVKVIALYVEGFDPGEGRRFFELARAMDKPVIIYKSGRTETGAQAAATHTASMSGDYDVFSAVCTQAGVVLTEDIEDHYNYIKAFSLLSEKKLRGPRVAGVVNSGFEATVAGDEIGSLVQAELTGVTRERLEKINKSGLVAITSTFLDISPMSDDQDYADYIEVLMQDDKVDSIFVSVIPHLNILKTDPERFDEPGSLGNQLVRIFRTYDKPMVVSVNAGNYYSDFVSLMEENGVPVFSDIRAAMHALDMFVSHNLEK